MSLRMGPVLKFCGQVNDSWDVGALAVFRGGNGHPRLTWRESGGDVSQVPIPAETENTAM